jgi:DNA-binding NarL/FixJ family response regulator
MPFGKPRYPAMYILKTFIVEDSPVIRQSLIATLEELAPVVVVGTAEDEAEATHWLAQNENAVDLVIVDIFLKAGSGLGVLRAAQVAAKAQHTLQVSTDAPSLQSPQPNNGNGTRTNPGPARRKLVVLSNYATADMRIKCQDLGADRVFDKSNDIDALLLYCNQLAQGEEGNTVPGVLP